MIDQIKKWTSEHYLQIAFLNLFLMFLVLLRSAGYFAPFFLISINFIVLVSLVLSVILFRLNSNFMFMISILFLLFASFIRFFEVEIWAERTTIYAFQGLIVATLLYILENIFVKKNYR